MPLDTTTEIITLTVAYLLGSIPFGLFVSWIFALKDPREVGSGNIGATNVLRLGNKGAALLTLFLDVLKGSGAVVFALIFAPPLVQLAGLFAMIGHIWPIWLGFRGGKGVATAFGVILVLSVPLTVLCLITWLVVAFTSRYSSLASLITVLLAPLYTAVLNGENLVVTCLAITLLIVWTHRRNIGRLVTGKETKIGENNSPPSL